MKVVGDAFLSTSSSHDGLGRYSRRLLARADLVFLLGTNALSADYRGSKFHWRVKWRDLSLLRGKVVLVGVGAHKGFEKVGWVQRAFLRNILSHDHVHSVRDNDAGLILENCGLNYLNTSCPTLWDCDSFPSASRRNRRAVCLTLTASKPDPSDEFVIRTLRSNYGEVYFWPQQQEDLAYLAEIRGDARITCIPGNLAAYDDFIRKSRPDYVGTRLHGGVRALSHGCRTLIISIDNRAKAMGDETGIPTVERRFVMDELVKRLEHDNEPTITVDAEKIEAFLNQFAALPDASLAWRMETGYSF